MDVGSAGRRCQILFTCIASTIFQRPRRRGEHACLLPQASSLNPVSQNSVDGVHRYGDMTPNACGREAIHRLASPRIIWIANYSRQVQCKKEACTTRFARTLYILLDNLAKALGFPQCCDDFISVHVVQCWLKVVFMHGKIRINWKRLLISTALIYF